jgi:hypothetical protein
MAEPERRRRRLRPPSSGPAALDAAAPETAALDAATLDAATPDAAAPEPVTRRPRPGPPVVETSAIEDPVDPAQEAAAKGENPAANGELAAARGESAAVGSGDSTAGGEAAAARSDDPAARGRARTRPPFSGPPPGGDDREAERGLRGLVGSGSSQVSVGAALRARDAARPTEAQLAEAEDSLPIIRRNWLPREDLPRNR